MPSSNASLDNALAFAEYGFPVFPVWGIHAGICRCPKGSFCLSPGKHPIPPDGLKAGTTDTSKLTLMLAAPGSGGNYGIVPAEHVAVIDIDGEDWVAKVRELGLPPTLMTLTANGCHLWYRWPDETSIPAKVYGYVVRSQEHPGYVIGPGSTHQSGFVYRLAHQNGHDIYTMLGRIANYPVTLLPEPTLALTVGPGTQPPERVPVGSRHDYLRDRARTLRGGGLTGDALKQAMLSINARLPEPKTEEEVERAIGEVETKFGEDPAPVSHVIEFPTPTIFIRSAADRLAPPATGDWLVSDLIRPGTIGLIASNAGVGKSIMRLELSMRLAVGRGPLFEHYGIPGPQTVLVFDGENGENEEWLREEDMCDSLAIPRTHLSQLFRLDDTVAFNLDLNQPEHQQTVEASIATYEPGVTIFDTIGTFTRGVEWGPELHKTMAFLKQLTRVREATWGQWRTAVLLLAHFGKVERYRGKRPSLDLNDVMGQWTRFMDWTATVNETDDEGKVRWQTAKRVPRTDLILEQQNGRWVSVKANIPSPTTAKEWRQRQLLAALLNGPKKVEGAGGLGAWLSATGDGVTDRTVYRDMGDLATKGWATGDDETGVWTITDTGRDMAVPVKLVAVPVSSSLTSTDTTPPVRGGVSMSVADTTAVVSEMSVDDSERE